MDEYTAANRRLWDAFSVAHKHSSFYDLDGFRAGRRQHPWDAAPGIRLHDYEIEEMGDVAGKDVLHLQCHIGTDTLSLARLGARVTGVDFSPAALDIASGLAAELGLDVQFVLSAIDDLTERLDNVFDVVYTSRGTLWWLGDLKCWASVVARYVKPGGFFYITDLHPFMHLFDVHDEELGLRHDAVYFPRTQPLSAEVTGSYAGEPIAPETEYGWIHSIGEIVSAVAGAGLRVEFLHEFDWCTEGFGRFVPSAHDGRFRLPPHVGAELPLMYSLRASKSV